MTAIAAFLDARFPTNLARFPYGHYVNCTLVTNQGNGVVGYAIGSLNNEGTTAYSQTIQHYFSDRSWDDPATRIREYFPFNPKAVDQTGVRIERTGPETLKITLTALSWGGGQSQVQIVGFNADTLYGIGPGAGAGSVATFLISLSQPMMVPG